MLVLNLGRIQSKMRKGFCKTCIEEKSFLLALTLKAKWEEKKPQNKLKSSQNNQSKKHFTMFRHKIIRDIKKVLENKHQLQENSKFTE